MIKEMKADEILCNVLGTPTFYGKPDIASTKIAYHPKQLEYLVKYLIGYLWNMFSFVLFVFLKMFLSRIFGKEWCKDGYHKQFLKTFISNNAKTQHSWF